MEANQLIKNTVYQALKNRVKDWFCKQTSSVLCYKVPTIPQRGLYLLGLFRRFILKVDGFQHPQAAFYIVPLHARARFPDLVGIYFAVL